MNDDEIRDLMALVALDALDPDEREAVERAIADRPDLMAELDELRAVVALLAESHSVAPPPDLKASILAQIAVTGQDPSAAARRVTAAPETVDGSPPTATGHPRVLVGESSPAGRGDVSMRRRRTALIAIAAAAVAVVAGAAIWNADDSSPQRAEGVEEVLELDDVQALELRGDMDGVRIMHSPSSTSAVLVADDMPDPGDELEYQLWFHHDGVPTPANVFRPDSSGHVEVLLEDFSAAGAVITVTIEPTGGSERPTSPALVSSA